MRKIVVAIDGPAGAGKSTVSRIAAKKLDLVYIDTGAMYRAVAWRTLCREKEVTDEAILDALHGITIELRAEEGGTRVLLNGADVSEEIRIQAVSRIVSRVAKLGAVREEMVRQQREMASRGGVLMDGRDIATNVLPNADVKIFLTASIEERARRRFEELKSKGYEVDLRSVRDEITRRDREDSERAIAPLIQADDAALLDTTGMTIEEVVAAILELCDRAHGMREGNDS